MFRRGVLLSPRRRYQAPYGLLCHLPLREYPSNIVNYLWGKRIKIILPPKEGVSEDLSNFPVKVWLSESSGLNSKDLSSVFTEITDSNRKKIAVTTSDGTTQCYVEVVSWDATNKQAELWVKVPTLSATSNTILYLYYDANQADNDTYVGDTGSTPAQAVWDTNFAAVYHMNDSPDGLQVLDSTANANHGTKNGCVEVEGLKGKAQSFDGVDDRITIPANASLNITDIYTIEANVKTTQKVIYAGIYGQDWVSSKTVMVAAINGGKWANSFGGISWKEITSINVSDDTWRMLSSSANSTESWGKLYVDGNQEGHYDGVTQLTGDTVSPYLIGQRSSMFAGLISEVRISNVARSASWIAATNATLRDELAIYSLESAPRDKSYARPFYPSGCIWTPEGFYFDGVDDLITFESDFIGASACTIMGWIKPTGWGGGGGGRIVDNDKLGFYVYVGGSALCFTSGNMVWILSANNSITLNQWQHVAVTRKSDGKTTLYINGEPSGTPDQASGTSVAGTTNIVVGNRLEGDRGFAGTIDDLLVYNRVLSLNEIRTHYEMTKWSY